MDIAIDKHVPPKYKLRFADIKGVVDLTVPSNAQPEQILLKEPGLYCLLLRSKKEEAEPFMDWVVETILPKEVRKLAQKIDEKDSALALLNDDLDESQLALQRERSLRRLQSHEVEIENLIINRHVPLSGRGYDEVFVIVKKNCDHNERFPLYLICRQKRSGI